MVLAATANLLVEYSGPAGGASPEQRDGLASAQLGRAMGLDPLSGFVWEQQARVHEARGEFSLARGEFGSSVQLNPASVDALAAYARLLAFGGGLAEAEVMAREAAGSPAPPNWYQGVPALLALRDGDHASALASAELYAQADPELGPILAIMAAQQLGDGAVVNRYLPQVLDVASFRAKGVLPRLRDRISDTALLDLIRAALGQAGVPPTALIRSF
jgi:tetratricopeptide (TPR) repeat protein